MQAWTVLAAAGLLASATSALIYWQLIVPQLPRLLAVPLWWWGFMLLPVGLVIVWAGYQARSLSQVLASAGAIVLPWVGAQAVYGLITGRPVGHDVWVTDLWYWLAVALQVVVCGVAVGLMAVLFRWRRHATASNTHVNPAAGAGPRR